MTDKLNKHLWLVILAGGSGTRFWPRSRASLPKQLLQIIGEETLLKTTIERFHDWISQHNIIIVTTKELVEPTKKAIASQTIHILPEPEGKNTAPCIVMTMEWIYSRDPQATVIVVPADHWISENKEYLQVMRRAVEEAQKTECLITIGIQPTRPETGYGYIRSGAEINPGVYSVERFVEKPKREVAETMVQHPEYFWNSGMFVWQLKSFFSELNQNAAGLADAFKPYREAFIKKIDPEKALLQIYKKISAISIDYALFEKAKHVAVVPGNFGWNDLGSFAALEEVYSKTEGGVARAKRVLALDSIANIIDCPKKTVALIGITDLIIVDTGDVLLLASRERAQDVKKIVERLRAEDAKDLL